MAKKLKEVDAPRGRGRTAMYPWDQWLDGHVWLIEHGTDFTIEFHSMRQMVYAAAKVRGLVASVERRGDDLVIQAFPR